MLNLAEMSTNRNINKNQDCTELVVCLHPKTPVPWCRLVMHFDHILPSPRQATVGVRHRDTSIWPHLREGWFMQMYAIFEYIYLCECVYTYKVINWISIYMYTHIHLLIYTYIFMHVLERVDYSRSFCCVLSGSTTK